jgi:hypothetical protein
MKQPPVDAVHTIISSTHGGMGSARPGEDAKLPAPVDGSQLRPDTLGGRAASTTAENRSQLCAIPGKDGSASAYCLGRYDVVTVKPQKKRPAVNTRLQ